MRQRSETAAIAIASSPIIFANAEMAIPAILYSLMMNIVLLIYVGLTRLHNNSADDTAAFKS